MVDIFPTCQFGFLTKEADIERQTLSGGTSVSGQTDRISADGGGRVFAEFSDGSLIDRQKVLSWRAMLTALEEGVNPIVVPFCDARHQPGMRAPIPVPHSDGATFSDGAEYIGDGGGLIATATTGAALRATSITFAGDLAESPLLGGEWFAINHAGKGWRAYRIRRIPAQTADSATVEFRPPLREAVAAGQELDFRNPKCLMVVDTRPSSQTTYGRATSAAARFVESP